MELADIYKCLSDETRLRILHLLSEGPLCVCHFQSILGTSQVAVSKHLSYLRARKVVSAVRHEQWMIYRIPDDAPTELLAQLRCLKECGLNTRELRNDLKRLKKVKVDCGWIDEACSAKNGRLSAKVAC